MMSHQILHFFPRQSRNDNTTRSSRQILVCTLIFMHSILVENTAVAVESRLRKSVASEQLQHRSLQTQSTTRTTPRRFDSIESLVDWHAGNAVVVNAGHGNDNNSGLRAADPSFVTGVLIPLAGTSWESGPATFPVTTTTANTEQDVEVPSSPFITSTSSSWDELSTNQIGAEEEPVLQDEPQQPPKSGEVLAIDITHPVVEQDALTSFFRLVPTIAPTPELAVRISVWQTFLNFWTRASGSVQTILQTALNWLEQQQQQFQRPTETDPPVDGSRRIGTYSPTHAPTTTGTQKGDEDVFSFLSNTLDQGPLVHPEPVEQGPLDPVRDGSSRFIGTNAPTPPNGTTKGTTTEDVISLITNNLGSQATPAPSVAPSPSPALEENQVGFGFLFDAFAFFLDLFQQGGTTARRVEYIPPLNDAGPTIAERESTRQENEVVEDVLSLITDNLGRQVTPAPSASPSAAPTPEQNLFGPFFDAFAFFLDLLQQGGRTAGRVEYIPPVDAAPNTSTDAEPATNELAEDVLSLLTDNMGRQTTPSPSAAPSASPGLGEQNLLGLLFDAAAFILDLLQQGGKTAGRVEYISPDESEATTATGTEDEFAGDALSLISDRMRSQASGTPSAAPSSIQRPPNRFRPFFGAFAFVLDLLQQGGNTAGRVEYVPQSPEISVEKTVATSKPTEDVLSLLPNSDHQGNKISAEAPLSSNPDNPTESRIQPLIEFWNRAGSQIFDVVLFVLDWLQLRQEDPAAGRIEFLPPPAPTPRVGGFGRILTDAPTYAVAVGSAQVNTEEVVEDALTATTSALDRQASDFPSASPSETSVSVPSDARLQQFWQFWNRSSSKVRGFILLILNWFRQQGEDGPNGNSSFTPVPSPATSKGIVRDSTQSPTTDFSGETSEDVFPFLAIGRGSTDVPTESPTIAEESEKFSIDTFLEIWGQARSTLVGTLAWMLNWLGEQQQEQGPAQGRVEFAPLPNTTSLSESLGLLDTQVSTSNDPTETSNNESNTSAAPSTPPTPEPTFVVTEEYLDCENDTTSMEGEPTTEPTTDEEEFIDCESSSSLIPTTSPSRNSSQESENQLSAMVQDIVSKHFSSSHYPTNAPNMLPVPISSTLSSLPTLVPTLPPISRGPTKSPTDTGSTISTSTEIPTIIPISTDPPTDRGSLVLPRFSPGPPPPSSDLAQIQDMLTSSLVDTALIPTDSPTAPPIVPSSPAFREPPTSEILKPSSTSATLLSATPSRVPSEHPSTTFSSYPTRILPTNRPTGTLSPISTSPTSIPSSAPSEVPTPTPMQIASLEPTSAPAESLSEHPSSVATLRPSYILSFQPTRVKSHWPSNTPTKRPTPEFSSVPTNHPTSSPSTSAPTVVPSPSIPPESSKPVGSLNTVQNMAPSSYPSVKLSSSLSRDGSVASSNAPSHEVTFETSSTDPTNWPKPSPSTMLSTLASDLPSQIPTRSSVVPSGEPSLFAPIPPLPPSKLESVARSETPSATVTQELSPVPSTTGLPTLMTTSARVSVAAPIAANVTTYGDITNAPSSASPSNTLSSEATTPIRGINNISNVIPILAYRCDPDTTKVVAFPPPALKPGMMLSVCIPSLTSYRMESIHWAQVSGGPNNNDMEAQRIIRNSVVVDSENTQLDCGVNGTTAISPICVLQTSLRLVDYVAAQSKPSILLAGLAELRPIDGSETIVLGSFSIATELESLSRPIQTAAALDSDLTSNSPRSSIRFSLLSTATVLLWGICFRRS